MLTGMTVLTAVLLAVAALAHLRLEAYQRSTRWFTRAVLLAIGLAFGWVMVTAYTDETSGLARVLVFVSAAALVHLPAAFVLQFKHWRGRDRREPDGDRSHG